MNWYAVYTKSRQERIAQENLERQSFETYLPLMVLRRKRRGEWVETVEPIFSRYLFIRLEPGTTNIASIRSTRGVTGLVQFGNQLAAVPESFVTTLLQTADAEDRVHTPEPDLMSVGGRTSAFSNWQNSLRMSSAIRETSNSILPSPTAHRASSSIPRVCLLLAGSRPSVWKMAFAVRMTGMLLMSNTDVTELSVRSVVVYMFPHCYNFFNSACQQVR